MLTSLPKKCAEFLGGYNKAKNHTIAGTDLRQKLAILIKSAGTWGFFAQKSLLENQTKENEAELNVKVCTALKAGRLAKYLPKWRKNTTDRTLLQYVQDVRIEFINGQPPTQPGFRSSMFNIHECRVVEKEIKSE